MKSTIFFTIIIVFSAFLFSGCNKPDDDSTPVYLVDFSEYTSTSKPYTAEAIKGYIEAYGVTDVAAMVKYDIKVYKVKYKTSFEGDTIIASGLIAVPVPQKSSNAFPMLSYQHGTITTNAESPTGNPQSEGTAFAIYMASTGYIVMIPDYIGFGSSSNKFPPPFMIKQYSVNAIIDFIRATKEFITTEKPCKTNNKLFLSGYFEGGSLTLATLSAIENDSRNKDLYVTASACRAGIYNLNTFRDWIVTQVKYDQPYLIADMLVSFKHYYDLDIEDSLVFNEKFASLIPEMFDGNKTSEQINHLFATLSIKELLYDKFREPDSLFSKNKNYDGLRSAFTENSVPAWNLKSYVTFYYGDDDMWVPNDQSLKIYSEFRTLGVSPKVKLSALKGTDDNGATILTLSNSVVWFKSIK